MDLMANRALKTPVWVHGAPRPWGLASLRNTVASCPPSQLNRVDLEGGRSPLCFVFPSHGWLRVSTDGSAWLRSAAVDTEHSLLRAPRPLTRRRGLFGWHLH